MNPTNPSQPGYGYQYGFQANAAIAPAEQSQPAQQPQYGYYSGGPSQYVNQQGTYGGPAAQQVPQAAQQPSHWSPLLHPNGQPTPLFQSLSAAIFAHLDRGAGYI